jgi:hypothetical protein
MAFEYQGWHHGTDPEVREYDAIKRRLCQDHGIELIEVVGIKKPFPPENVLRQVQDAFRKAGRTEVPRLPAHDIVFPSKLEVARAEVRQRGWTLVAYRGDDDLEVKCANSNHLPWKTSLWRIRHRGHGCPDCAGNRRLGLDGLRAWGQQHGLHLDDETWRGAGKPYRWRCVRSGHLIERSKENIQQSLAKGRPACTTCASS